MMLFVIVICALRFGVLCCLFGFWCGFGFGLVLLMCLMFMLVVTCWFYLVVGIVCCCLGAFGLVLLYGCSELEFVC